MLSHLWKYHSPILADNIAQLYTKPRLPHEPVVKDDVLRYNPAEDLLIQINNLLSYFLETDEIKPVTADLRSEVIYEISQGLLLLEEVCEFHVCAYNHCCVKSLLTHPTSHNVLSVPIQT